MDDTTYMRMALEEAALAAKEEEVPVGAVLVYEGNVLTRDHNRMIQQKNPLAHAELLTLLAAVPHHPNRWLLDSALYVTLEPCAMCATALVLSRVKRLVFGAFDPKAGACGSVFNLAASPQLNHRLEITSSILQDEASRLLKDFFQELRR